MAVPTKRSKKAASASCAPAKPARKAAAKSRGKAATKRAKAAAKKAKAKSAAAARGASAGGGASATSLAKRRAGLAAGKAKAASAGCAPTSRRKALKQVVQQIAPKPAPTPTPAPVTAPKPPSVAPSVSKPTPATPQSAQNPSTPAPTGSTLPAATAPSGAAPSTTPPVSTSPTTSGFGRREAERLLWRAGFGPRPGDVDRLVALGMEGAVDSLLNPGTEAFVGPEPKVNGKALDATGTWGHDQLLLMDRMVRSTDQLRWRMVLVWHDWFATSRAKVQLGSMLEQVGLFWIHALGKFDDLARDVTVNPAMLDWLDGIRNTRTSPNENYAREFFELFTLGANRGAYTEQDIREAARALTGWRADWDASTNQFVGFRFDSRIFDPGQKTIFGKTGAFGWQDVVRLAVEHPKHAGWFVTRLWSAFVGEPADAGTQARLEQLYVDGGRQVKPVLRAILTHPRFYAGPSMVKPPVVQTVGLLRTLERGIDTDVWAWLSDMSGQVLLAPPNVAGWDERRWMSTGTWAGRWHTATFALATKLIDPWNAGTPYDAAETPAQAVDRALGLLGNPTITTAAREELLRFATASVSPTAPDWQRGPLRAMRQNALRMLIATSGDFAVC
ncbi:DUF1800 family protein [Conexibacter sp. SYSU D00693]|uniref:DUF1800 domain-containing protein n=1 Tax=Conexibacter sp. SYSU D00693 TaxID=2812560 RepID=UPI00196A5C2A|nr:DUF1800 domain-containing protein [Conexibacter sp. SYSU D00693]